MIEPILEFNLIKRGLFNVTIVASFSDALTANSLVVAAFVLPLAIFTIIIHLLERTIQKRLAERFGWSSVLWTGWLGTPIHELSHAAMCVLFRHRIDEISLFEPDQQSGRLGYVKHSWRKGNWFEELGNFFIGIAPLIGGCMALFVLMQIFYGPPTSDTDLPALAPAVDYQPWAGDQVMVVVQRVFDPVNFLTLRFWAFMYLVLCIGSHMAPSWSDYRGAGKGAIMVLIAMGALIFFASAATTDPSHLFESVTPLLSPLIAMLLITIILCLVATIIVSTVVSYFPKRYQVG
jgi:hypothetical protein